MLSSGLADNFSDLGFASGLQAIGAGKSFRSLAN